MAWVLPASGYRPPRRERLTLTLDAFRPPPFEDLQPARKGEPDPRDERAKDALHLARRLNKRLRRPCSQGPLTGQMERVFRAVYAFAKGCAVCRPTYAQLMQAAGVSCDVVTHTLHFGEVFGFWRVVNHRDPGRPVPAPNSYVMLPVPSRSATVTSAARLDTKEALFRELRAAQDREIVRVAAGLHGLRWLAAWRQRALQSWVSSYEERVRHRAREEGRDPEAAVQAARQRSRVRPLTPSAAKVFRRASTAPRRQGTEPPPPRIARPESQRQHGAPHTGIRSEFKVNDSTNRKGGAETPKHTRPPFDPAALRAWALNYVERLKKRRPPNGRMGT